MTRSNEPRAEPTLDDMDDAAQVCVSYKAVAATQEGQIVIRDLVRRFGYARGSTFHPDPAIHARNEGQRTVLVYIGQMLDAQPSEIEENRKVEMEP